MPPKRRMSVAAAARKGTKKLKTIRDSRHRASDDATSAHSGTETKRTVRRNSRAVRPPVADEDHEWEILDGDNRETLLVGATAPNRLRIRFRHRYNDKQAEIVHQYKKAANEVDWSNSKYIMDINRWRNQVFHQSMGFPPKVTRTSWTPFETAYLELLHEKLKLVASTDAEFKMPHNTRILEAFNEYFEYRDDMRDKKGGVMEPLGARNSGQLTSYMNRKGSKIRQLRENLSRYETSNDADAYFPTMTDDEIQDYLDGVEVTSVEGDDAKPGEHIHDLRSASQSLRKIRPKLQSPQKSSQAQQDATDNSEPKKKPRWLKPPETTVVPDTPEYFASLEARGYTWSDIPESNDEAIELHQAAQDKKPTDNTWIRQATNDLDDRIKRRSSQDFQHETFNRDLHENYEGKGARKNVEDWHEISARRDGAAAVTSLLNTADIPPRGYTGNIRDLHRKRLLSEGELQLADAREDAIDKRHHAIEHQRLSKIERESEEDAGMKAMHDRATALQEDDLYYDSEVTTADFTTADDTDDKDGNDQDG